MTSDDTQYQPTYWFHPESDSYWIALTPEEAESDGDGMSIELESEYEYVKGLIKQIDDDPEHKLPEGITAVIKMARRYFANEMDKDRTKHIDGFIYYDSLKRFKNGYPINTSEISGQEPGGIYITALGHKYLVEVIQHG